MHIFVIEMLINVMFGYPMLSPPCESVQICKDPDGYSRIHQKLNRRKNSFENEISC